MGKHHRRIGRQKPSLSCLICTLGQFLFLKKTLQKFEHVMHQHRHPLPNLAFAVTTYQYFVDEGDPRTKSQRIVTD